LWLATFRIGLFLLIFVLSGKLRSACHIVVSFGACVCVKCRAQQIKAALCKTTAAAVVICRRVATSHALRYPVIPYSLNILVGKK